MKPTLKAPGMRRLKPKYEKLLSSFAFNVNLRRYTEVVVAFARQPRRCLLVGGGLHSLHFKAQLADLQDTSLTSELTLSTLGTHPRVNLGYMRDKVSLS